MSAFFVTEFPLARKYSILAEVFDLPKNAFKE